jgi:hypothetical protein
MLDKFKRMPLSVKLSVLFLLGLITVGVILEPFIAIGLILVVLTLLSVGRLVDYLLNGEK